MLKSKLSTLLCMVLALMVVVGCGESQTASNQTPTPTQFTNLDLHLSPSALNAPVTGTLPDDQKLHVAVTFKVDQAALDKLGQGNKGQQGDANTPDTVKKLGISDEDFAKIKQYFGVDNATINLSGTHTRMTVDIAAGSLARLLQTRFVTHQLQGRTFYTPDPQMLPKIPTAIADKILTVTGLDSYSQKPGSKASMQPLKGDQQAANNCLFDSPAVNLSQLAHAYGYDGLWNAGYQGEGMTINLVEIDGVDSKDLQEFNKCYGYGGHLSFVGPTLAPGMETTMDIQLLMALAPKADIVDYQAVDASWTALGDALQQILDDSLANPKPGSVVSMSIGGPEETITESHVQAISQTLHMLYKAAHTTVFLSSGDCGAFVSNYFGGEEYGKLGVDFPASDPYGIGVGGTLVNVDGKGNRTDEGVWVNHSAPHNKCDNSWGSGGGVSALYKQTDWQTGLGVKNQYSNGARQVPDLSGAADYLPVVYGGKWVYGGGTSAAAPIWAAGIALVNQGLLHNTKMYVYGPLIPYTLANEAGKHHPYYDVVKGDNHYYKATPGWDYGTGFGAPNLPDVYNTIIDLVKK